LRKKGGVVKERVWSPHEWDTVDLAVRFDERQVSKFRRELSVGWQFRKIEGAARPVRVMEAATSLEGEITS